MTSFQLTKEQRQRLFAVIIPISSGKTTLAEKLSIYRHKQNKNHIFIDIDEFASKKIKNIEELVADSTHREIRLFPVLRAEIVKILNEYSTSVIVVLTANSDFANFLQIKDKRKTVCVPTRNFAADMYKNAIGEINDFQTSRENILASYSKVCNIYNTMNDLVTTICTVFNLVLSPVANTPRNCLKEEKTQ